MKKSILSFVLGLFALVTLLLSCQEKTKSSVSVMELSDTKKEVAELQEIDSQQVSSKIIHEANRVE